MGGYANRVITIQFPELSEEGNQIFVVLRNPKTVALSKLETKEVSLLPDGTVDQEAAAAAGYATLTKLIIGGRLFNAMADEVDHVGEDGIPVLVDQPPLTYPISVEDAQKLPTIVIGKIFETINEAQNPR